MSFNYEPWPDDKASSVVQLKPKVNKLGSDLDDLLGDAPTAQNKDSDANPTVPDLWAELDEMLAEQKQFGAKPIGSSTPKKPGLVKFKDTAIPLNLSADLPKGHSFLFGEGGIGLLPMGSLTVMAAPGGMMKTTLAMSWSVYVASGQAWNGMRVRKGAVLFVSMEDDPDETMRKGIGITRAQIESGLHSEVERCLHMAMCYGIDTRLTSSAFGANQRTGAVDQIIDFAKGLEATCGEPVTLIVFDHARLAIGGDVNDSGAVTELTRALNLIGKLTGAAILLLCHSPKSTVNPNHSGIHTAADVLGSGAFVDNARQAIVLSTLIDDERKHYGLSLDDAKKYVAMRVIKSNYSETDRVSLTAVMEPPMFGVMEPRTGS
jgi:hypothetical protein